MNGRLPRRGDALLTNFACRNCKVPTQRALNDDGDIVYQCPYCLVVLRVDASTKPPTLLWQPAAALG